MIHATNHDCLRLEVIMRETMERLKNATCPEAYEGALEQDGIDGREEETVEAPFVEGRLQFGHRHLGASTMRGVARVEDDSMP